MTTTLNVAKWLAHQGMHVFPLSPFGKRPLSNCAHCKNSHAAPEQCPCLTADRPCHGLLAATTDLDQIRRWWRQTPHANVGINTGLSGLVVLDLDRKDKAPAPVAHDVPTVVADGLGALDAITATERVGWPDTLTIATPSDGRHLYFRCPPGLEVTSDATGRVGHQVDLRASGGYVVAPGCSITAPPEDTTGTYQRVSSTVDIAPLPAWLRARVAPPVRPGPVKAPNLGAVGQGNHAPGYWQRVWEAELGKVETRDGERWRLLYAAARRLANLATHDRAPWSETEVLDALEVAAIRRRQRAGKPIEQATARRNAQRGWQRGTHDGPNSLLGWGSAA